MSIELDDSLGEFLFPSLQEKLDLVAIWNGREIILRDILSVHERLAKSLILFDPEAKVPPHPLRFGERSLTFQTAGNPLPSHLRIGGINGINNTFEEAKNHANRFSGYAQGHSIEWVYNSTHSAPIDVVGTFLLNYLGIPTLPSFLLRANWERFHKENEQNPEAKYLQICHSQGAIHVKNALLHCPKKVRERIIVVAFGPAAVVSEKLCCQSYNYASDGDLIPYGEITTSVLVNLIQAIKNFTNLKELKILAAHSDTIGYDHGLDSPTFAPILEKHIHAYLEGEAKAPV